MALANSNIANGAFKTTTFQPALPHIDLDTNSVAGASRFTPLSPLKKVFNLGGRRSPVLSFTESAASRNNDKAPAAASATTIALQPLQSRGQEDDGSLEAGSSNRTSTQARPALLSNLFAEVVFVLVCSFGLLFSVSQGTVGSVLQIDFVSALGIQVSQAPWLVGAFFLASGLSVVISGALADLASPKNIMLGALAWATLWSIIGCFSLDPSRNVLFFVVRAMQGVSAGALSSVPMSILGRVYNPGQRKNRAFATMGAMAPLGALVGAVQGGALQHHLPWVFGSSAIACGILFVATMVVVPNLQPESDVEGVAPPSLRDLDYLGTLLAMAGCACILSGLTQGSPAGWSPYTYILVIVGVLLLVAFGFAERRAKRPLVSNRLWTTPGFAPLGMAYFLGFGAFLGCYQFYSFRFWLTIQNKPPILLAAYKAPDAIAGICTLFLLSKLLHRVRGHYILIAGMIFYCVGPAFFLWQRPDSSYWTAMPGVALAALGPDLTFTAAAIFVTSSVERSYQGSAGSVLVTIQNMSAAVVTSVADSLASGVTRAPAGELDLDSLRATWWLGLGLAAAGAILCATMLRMPATQEKEHVA